LFAAMHPDRVSALVLNSTWARAERAPDYPFGPDPAAREQGGLLIRAQWGNLDNPWGFEGLAPSRLDDPSFRQVLARVQQVSASRAAASAEYLNAENDVRAVLSLVQAPTLVLCGAPLPLVSSECVVSLAPCLAVFLQGWPAWRRNESRSRGSAR